MFEQERDDAYRAIGRYIVEFSDLIREMRELACEYVAKGVEGMAVSALLLGEATPQVIANAFFGMCRTYGKLDDDETKVFNALRNTARAAIETRNDVAHGDWAVGNIKVKDEGQAELAPPQLIRIIPARGEGPLKRQVLTTRDLDRLSDELQQLQALIQDFGRLALKLPVFDHDPERPSVSRSDYRVSDVLVVTGGNKRSPAKVVREGPHAEHVFGGLYSVIFHSSSARRSASD